MLHDSRIAARVLGRDGRGTAVSVPAGSMLSAALAAANVREEPGTALSQNGRRAQGTDELKPGATVSVSPAARNG